MILQFFIVKWSWITGIPKKPTGEDLLARGECSTAMTAQFSQSPAPAVRERAADLQAAHATGNEYLVLETSNHFFGDFMFFFLLI